MCEKSMVPSAAVAYGRQLDIRPIFLVSLGIKVSEFFGSGM